MKTSKSISPIGIFVVSLITVFVFNGFGSQDSKIGQKLSKEMDSNQPDELMLVWIFFNDKGTNSERMLSHPEIFLTKESIERRVKRVKSSSIADVSDLPLSSEYISEIINLGINIKQKSKWFNSVSCYANKIQIQSLIKKNFVKKAELVVKYKGKYDRIENIDDNGSVNQNYTDNVNTEEYGPSIVQDSIINIIPVHQSGNRGNGVLIASFDAGFDNLQHPCFARMISNGLRTYDFVNGDTIVADGTGRLGQGFHGTLTLSLIAGYDPGFLISPAFDAKYILAKTENTQSETPLEEDNWIAAAEWADSLGADIITCSLGYTTFEAPYEEYSYTWESMDGNTARITKAADLAVGKGIIVVISSGNAGFNSTHNTLSAPADGDSVITVGSVNTNLDWSAFSSVGPTTDGRIKPDVMALGRFNYCARVGAGNTGYSSGSFGTSLSCPMIAGVCGLILSANPDLSPIEVRDILRSTAGNNLNPNNRIGWGIVDADAAVIKARNFYNFLAEDFRLQQNYPNPFNPSTTFRFDLRKNANLNLNVYDISGRLVVKVLNDAFYTAGRKELQYNFNSSGISSGVYFYSLTANGQHVESRKMILVK
ncbi:MAG: S8 family serine peptidase [Ignavibacteria bacterium]